MALTTTASIIAETRTDTGKGVARQLRKQGRVPAVVYGRGRASQPLTVSMQEMERTLTAGIATSLIDLTVDGTTVKALVREVQRHPFRPGILHVDFYEVHEGETITLNVPIHLVGTPEGVRHAGGVLDQSLREVEIEVLPKDIPERVELDVTRLGVGQSLHISDLNIPNAVVLEDADQTVCSVVPPRVEETEAEEVEEVAEEPELIRKPKEEGEPED